MRATVDSLGYEYTRRYTAHDAEGVTELCVSPFLAVREGIPIHLADRDAVRDHFVTIMDAYRLPSPPSGGTRWTPTGMLHATR
jgi:hypothetical protein